ncbi:MAG: cell division protease FtsH, partial [Paraburkholderia sp.]|nr:cell division protease FtsH [Paraburkholderia sp.]
MKPASNSLWSRVGRYVTLGVSATALVATGMLFLHWRHQQSAQAHPALTGLAGQMREDASAWAQQEKDASKMLRDIRERHVAAIGVSRNAILVSTKEGE